MKTNYLFLYENQKKVVYYKNKKFYIKINNENYNITKCFQKNTNLINPIYKKKFLLIDSDDDTGKAKKDKFKCKRKRGGGKEGEEDEEGIKRRQAIKANNADIKELEDIYNSHMEQFISTLKKDNEYMDALITKEDNNILKLNYQIEVASHKGTDKLKEKLEQDKKNKLTLISSYKFKMKSNEDNINTYETQKFKKDNPYLGFGGNLYSFRLNTLKTELDKLLKSGDFIISQIKTNIHESLYLLIEKYYEIKINQTLSKTQNTSDLKDSFKKVYEQKKTDLLRLFEENYNDIEFKDNNPSIDFYKDIYSGWIYSVNIKRSLDFPEFTSWIKLNQRSTIKNNTTEIEGFIEWLKKDKPDFYKFLFSKEYVDTIKKIYDINNNFINKIYILLVLFRKFEDQYKQFIDNLKLDNSSSDSNDKLNDIKSVLFVDHDYFKTNIETVIYEKIKSKIIKQLETAVFDLDKLMDDNYNVSAQSTIQSDIFNEDKKTETSSNVFDSLKKKTVSIPTFKLKGGAYNEGVKEDIMIRNLLTNLNSTELNSTELLKDKKMTDIKEILEDEIKLLEKNSKKLKIYTIAEINSKKLKVINYEYLLQRYIYIYDNFINKTIKLTEISSKNRLKECLEKFIQIYDWNIDENISVEGSSSIPKHTELKNLMYVIISDIFNTFFDLNILKTIKFYEQIYVISKVEKIDNLSFDNKQELYFYKYFKQNKASLDDDFYSTQINESDDFFNKLEQISSNLFNKDIIFILHIYLTSIFKEKKEKKENMKSVNVHQQVYGGKKKGGKYKKKGGSMEINIIQKNSKPFFDYFENTIEIYLKLYLNNFIKDKITKFTDKSNKTDYSDIKSVFIQQLNFEIEQIKLGTLTEFNETNTSLSSDKIKEENDKMISNYSKQLLTELIGNIEKQDKDYKKKIAVYQHHLNVYTSWMDEINEKKIKFNITEYRNEINNLSDNISKFRVDLEEINKKIIKINSEKFEEKEKEFTEYKSKIDNLMDELKNLDLSIDKEIRPIHNLIKQKEADETYKAEEAERKEEEERQRKVKEERQRNEEEEKERQRKQEEERQRKQEEERQRKQEEEERQKEEKERQRKQEEEERQRKEAEQRQLSNQTKKNNLKQINSNINTKIIPNLQEKYKDKENLMSIPTFIKINNKIRELLQTLKISKSIETDNNINEYTNKLDHLIQNANSDKLDADQLKKAKK